MPETRGARTVRATRPMIAGFVAVTTASFSPLPAAAQPASTMKVLLVGTDSGIPGSFHRQLAADTTVVLLVRHAERVSDAPNSDLSAAGLERAEHIAALAAEAGVQAVYATDFCRSTQTAQPTAATLGLPIRVVATGNASAGLDACSPSIEVQRDVVEAPTPADIAQRVLREQRGRTVLVVGHSNTVPAIAEALGATVCPTLLQPDEQDRCWLTDDRYDDLFTLRVPAVGGTVRVKLGSMGLR